MNSNRISESFYDKNNFDEGAPDDNTALKNSGFNDNVTYIPSQSKFQSNYLVQSPN